MVADALPGVDEDQDEGPILLFGVIGDGLRAEQPLHGIVDEARFGGEEGEHDVADDNGGNQMGKQDHGLIEVLDLVFELAQYDGHGDGQHRVHHNER